RSLLQDSPDGVLIITGAIDAALLCQHIRKNNRSVRMYICGWAGSPDFINNGGKAVEGVLFAQNIDYSNTRPDYMTFVKKYRNLYGMQPNHGSVFSYEMTNILLMALKDGSRTSDEIRHSILTHDIYHGLQYDFSIDKNGDGDRPYFFTVVKNGSFVRVP
ncbi:MAG TPA: ABC transporter substrate-binding protein, partial [Spirochaetota bacterium]